MPENTASVIAVNIPSVENKSNFGGESSTQKVLRYFSNYGFSNETFDFAMSTLFNRADSIGVNHNSRLYAYLIPSKEFRNAYRCILVSLTDSARFASYVRNNAGINYNMLSGAQNCVCYINTNDRFSWIAYNDEVAVFGCSAIHTKGILECVNTIFDKKKSLASNRDFCTFDSQLSDAGMWTSTTDMLEAYSLWYNDLPQNPIVKNIPEKVMKDNYIHLNLAFEESLSVNFECIPSRALRAYWEKNKFTRKPDHNKFYELCRHVKEPLWFASLAINPEKLLNLCKDSDVATYMDKELAKLNLTTLDFANSFTGDCVYGMYDVTFESVRTFRFMQNPATTMLWKHLQNDEKTLFPHLVFAFALNDDKIPNMVLNHISSEICEQLAPGYFNFSKIMGFPLYVVCKDKTLLVLTDKSFAEDELKQDYTQSYVLTPQLSQFCEESSNYTSYHYMDCTVKNYSQPLLDYLQQQNILSLVESYSSIVKSAKMYLTDTYSGNIVVDFQDTTKNSLVQLDYLLEIVFP
mgnify:CR=1 FL=1